MDTVEFLKFATEVKNEFGLIDWNIKFDKAVKRNGQCDHNLKTLSFSIHYISRNPQSMILNTLLHEIAHALVGPNHGHNAVWKRKCIEIGLTNPTRCTNSDMPKGRYQAVCNNCGPTSIYRHRLRSNLNWTHIVCKSPVTWRVVDKVS